MRYKFRGLDINGKWVYGLLSISNGGRLLPEKGYYISNRLGHPWAFQVRFETVGQYTGLKDKHGKEVYEGDKIRERFSVMGEKYRNDEIFEGTVIWWDSGWFLDTKEHGTISLTDGADEIEIIGNIYE